MCKNREQATTPMNVAILLFMITNLNCHHSRNPAMRPTSFRGIGNPPMKAAPAPAVPNQACTSFHNCKPRPIHWKIKAAICGKVQELAAKCRNLQNNHFVHVPNALKSSGSKDISPENQAVIMKLGLNQHERNMSEPLTPNLQRLPSNLGLDTIVF